MTGRSGAGRDALAAEVERLRATVAELNEFVSVVTHDLQEPLRSITGFGELLRRHGADLAPEQREEYLGHMVDAAGRAQERVAGLAHYVRLGGRELHLKEVDLDAVVDAALDAVADELAASGGRVEVHRPLPTVTADPTMVAEVLRELVSNAVRFRSAERPLEVAISATVSGGSCTVTVADNGIGVPAEHRARVLGVFERMHSRSQYPGHGFGLAVAQRVAERHRGALVLDDGIDGGLAVRFSLPVAGPADERAG